MGIVRTGRTWGYCDIIVDEDWVTSVAQRSFVLLEISSRIFTTSDRTEFYLSINTLLSKRGCVQIHGGRLASANHLSKALRSTLNQQSRTNHCTSYPRRGNCHYQYARSVDYYRTPQGRLCDYGRKANMPSHPPPPPAPAGLLCWLPGSAPRRDGRGC